MDYKKPEHLIGDVVVFKAAGGLYQGIIHDSDYETGKWEYFIRCSSNTTGKEGEYFLYNTNLTNIEILENLTNKRG